MQKRILEAIFPSEWFLKTPQKSHPAFLRWNLCNTIIQQEGAIRYPEQRSELPRIAQIVLDSHILVALTRGQSDELKLGSLDLYGDKQVVNKIRSRITDSEQFEDLMVELYVGAWHITENHAVTPIEKDGLPDLRVGISGIPTPVFIECKHMRVPSQKRIAHVVTKANKQIKNAIPNLSAAVFGILILDISTAVGIKQVQNDDVPKEVQRIMTLVQSALNGPKNRSIGAAIVTWDDYMVMGTPPERTMFGFRRRYKLIQHPNARTPITSSLRLFNGYTVTYHLHWTPRLDAFRGIVFSEIFDQEWMKRCQITRSKVREALGKPDKSETVVLNGDKDLTFFSRLDPSGDHHTLGFGERVAEGFKVLCAFDIPTDLCDGINALSPVQILGRFASAYGLYLTIGELTSKFVLLHRIKTSSGDKNEIVAIHNPENHDFMNSFFIKISQADKGEFVADCAMLFCIDTTKYVSRMLRDRSSA